jgi:hypothetical protein
VRTAEVVAMIVASQLCDHGKYIVDYVK